MGVDIQSFFNRNGVEYIDKGKNVKKGHINISCPFCHDDPSHHLGINESTLAWSCWRDTSHRSNYPHKLIKKLLGWPWPKIQAVFGGNAKPDLTEFDKLAENLWAENAILEDDLKRGKLRFPKSFRRIEQEGTTEKFWEYLYERGFDDDDVENLCLLYGLRCCVSGDWRNRVILPITLDGELVTWTGRSIYKEAELRYRNLDVDESILNAKHTIYNFDEALNNKGDKLYLVEGPFDVIKLDYFLQVFGSKNRAVGMFNMSPTEEQSSLLSELRPCYKEFVVLLDNGELMSSTHILGQLSFLGNLKLGQLPSHVKDPGELTPDLIKKYFA